MTPPARKRAAPSRRPKRAAKRAAAKPRKRAAKKARVRGCVVNGHRIAPEWLELLLELPGYDPRDQAVVLELQEDGTTLEIPCHFDQAAAEHALGFMVRHCRHVKGKQAGKPVELERWQRAIVGNLFGWKRADGTRRYRECLVYLPRKNGKTTLAACVILYLLTCDGEYGAEIYSAAGAKEQAAKIWEILDGMREVNPELATRTVSYSNAKALAYPRTRSTYRAIPSDAKLLHGGDSHGVVIDELHVLRANEQLVEVLRTSTAARVQPLVLYLTTADHAGESVCNRTHRRAKECQAAKGDRTHSGYDPEFLPVVYEATTADDWTDPATWRKANPNLGTSVGLSYMASAAKQAVRSPTKRNSFLRLHLNVVTDADVAWVPMELWDACAGPHSWQQLRQELEGLECYAGLDLASRRDLAALALYFPERHAFLWWAWMPQQRARDLAADRGETHWQLWAELGALELSPGRSIDQGLVRRRLEWAHDVYQVQTVSFDRWGSHKLRKEMEDAGMDVAEFGQGYRDMSEPTKELEQLWLDGVLEHGGHPVARQAAANTTVQEDPAANLKPIKDKSTGPIDPIVAAIMALGGSLVDDGGEDEASVYETRGVRRLGASRDQDQDEAGAEPEARTDG